MLLNDYDDVLEWVKEQLMVLHQKETQSKEEQGYLPVQEVGESYLWGDYRKISDLSKGMVVEEVFLQFPIYYALILQLLQVFMINIRTKYNIKIE